jgi:hypothetical protein
VLGAAVLGLDVKNVLADFNVRIKPGTHLTWFPSFLRTAQNDEQNKFKRSETSFDRLRPARYYTSA